MTRFRTPLSLLALGTAGLALTACGSGDGTEVTTAADATTTTSATTSTSSSTSSALTTTATSATPRASESADCADAHRYEMGLKYQQQSAEIRALQEQTYRFATQRLEEIVEQHEEDKIAAARGKDLAIVTDLDETAIDNTPMMVRDMEKCQQYSTWDTWGKWEQEGHPTVIPGALEFFEKADELGVDIFYISDRTEENFEDTVATLKELNFPQVSDDNVLLLGPDKQERREKVEQDHTVVMLLGDTLHDFDEDFATHKNDVAKQRELVDENSDKLGTEWIVFPNSAYGRWENEELESWDE